MAELLLGLHYCHHGHGREAEKRRVLHRDIKPANVRVVSWYATHVRLIEFLVDLVRSKFVCQARRLRHVEAGYRFSVSKRLRLN